MAILRKAFEVDVVAPLNCFVRWQRTSSVGRPVRHCWALLPLRLTRWSLSVVILPSSIVRGPARMGGAHT